ncbi:DUF2523 family protein [Terasakiella pusilla]|uniref:DUF2523 family protein n=1 Tax=Terasakiella pusilla TaxID=64973 RepID=UPI003AA80D35
MLEFFNDVISFFGDIKDWIYSGIYTFTVDAYAYFIKQSVKAYIGFMITAIPFAWDVAQSIMNDLNISSYLDSAWGTLDAPTRSILAYLKIPEGVNFILSSAVTRFVLRFIPGF